MLNQQLATYRHRQVKELLKCGCEDLQVRRMGKIDKVMMENMTQLLENMSKMTSTMADALATIRSCLFHRYHSTHVECHSSLDHLHAYLPAYHG